MPGLGINPASFFLVIPCGLQRRGNDYISFWPRDSIVNVFVRNANLGAVSSGKLMFMEELHFSEQGLIPGIVQDAGTLQVLMLAWVSQESLQKMLETRETWFWSRSRQKLWHKGESSGNTQQVKEIRYDCDADTLLILVEPAGPACHTGETSCFFRRLDSQ